MGRGNHNTDPFALQSSRSESGDETNARKDRVEDIATAVSSTLRAGVGWEVYGERRILTPWCGTVWNSISLSHRNFSTTTYASGSVCVHKTLRCRVLLRSVGDRVRHVEEGGCLSV